MMNQNEINSNENKIQTVELSKASVKQLVLLILFAVVAGWALHSIDVITGWVRAFISALTPLIAGFCIAFVANLLLMPAEKLWDKCWGKKADKAMRYRRGVCLTLSMLLLAGFLFALVFMFIPLFRKTALTFFDSLPVYVTNLDRWLNGVIEWIEGFGFEIPEITLDPQKIIDPLSKFFAQYGSNLFAKTLGFTSSVFSGIFNAILAIAFSVYMLVYKEKIIAFSDKTLDAFTKTKGENRVKYIAKLTNESFTNFITGQLTEAAIIGVLCFIGMLILRIPYAPIVSVMIGVTALIPIVGACLGTIVGAFFILLVQPVKAIWFVVFILILQQIESNLIYPKIVGESVGLPGILVLASVTISGAFFGMFGIFISVPVCSVLYTLFKQIVDKRLEEERSIQNEDNC